MTYEGGDISIFIVFKDGLEGLQVDIVGLKVVDEDVLLVGAVLDLLEFGFVAA